MIRIKSTRGKDMILNNGYAYRFERNLADKMTASFQQTIQFQFHIQRLAF